MSRPSPQAAFRIALVYVILAGLWILLSDRILEALVSDTILLARLQTVKGWAFVAVTTLLLYSLFRRELQRRQSTIGYRRRHQWQPATHTGGPV